MDYVSLDFRLEYGCWGLGGWGSGTLSWNILRAKMDFIISEGIFVQAQGRCLEIQGNICLVYILFDTALEYGGCGSSERVCRTLTMNILGAKVEFMVLEGIFSGC